MSKSNKDSFGVRVINHLEIRRPSIERIKTLCDECLEHNSSWWEFKKRCEELLKQESRIIEHLSDNKALP